VKLALIGCGGIAGAHVGGLKQLREKGIEAFEVVAACDVVEEKAQERAAEIGEFQDRKPEVFADVHRMLEKVPEAEAVDICTLHSEHHDLAVACLAAGRHVIIEKPLAITMRAGQRILDASIAARKVLSVAENYRRSPWERTVKWALGQGRIGRPRTFFWQDVGEGLGKWGWRNFRLEAGGGWVLDGGVHFADLFRYHLGTDARQVFAVTRQYEPYRYDDPKTRTGAWRVDVEDAAMALVEFEGGAVVQWTWVGSAPGQRFSRRTLYGSEGCLDWESGLWQRDETHVDKEALTKEYMDGLAADEKERLFPAGLTDTIAVELNEFAGAIRSGTVPEVDGMEGFKAMAICMALFESAWLNRPVSLQEVERCQVDGYQAQIDRALGIA
jgi:predicted dehydrogenase